MQEAETDEKPAVLSRRGIHDVPSEEAVDRIHLEPQAFRACGERVRKEIRAGAKPPRG